MLKINTTNSFEKDYISCFKRNLDLNLLSEVIKLLEQNGTLPNNYKPHKLKGKWAKHWECHIKPDWLLIWYFNSKTEITFVRTGSHSDLF